MKKALCILLLLCLLLMPVCAAEGPARTEITSLDAIFSVQSNGECNVELDVTVDFPDGASLLMLPLPADAEEISAPGLKTSLSSAEGRQLLFLEKSGGFASSDSVAVSYRLPQPIETWDRKQILSLPFLFDDWNCSIRSCSFTVQLPAAFESEAAVLDADGDPVRNLLTETVQENGIIFESMGVSFTPEMTYFEMEFPDGYFTLPSPDASEALVNTTQITSLAANCTVDADSSCYTELVAEYSFFGSQPVVQLPVPQDAYDISVGEMKFTSEKQSGCNLLTVENPAGFSGMQTFRVCYRVLTSAIEQDDVQQFSLPLVFSQWSYPILNFQLTLTMPQPFEGLPEFISSYYNDQIDNYLNIKIDEGVISAESLQPLMEQESLTVRLSLPGDYFDLRFLQGRFSGTDILLFWVFTAFCILYWFFFLRIRIRRVTPVSDAPMNCNAGQVPYLLRLKPPSLGLMAATWASLGYIFLERRKKRQQLMVCRIDMGNERSHSETQLFSELFSKKSECRTDSPTFCNAQARCLPLTQNDWQSRLFRRHSGTPLILRLLGLGAAVFASLLVFDTIVTPQSFRWLLIIPLTVLAAFGALLLQSLAGLHFARHPWKKRIAAYIALAALLTLGAVSGCFGLMLCCCLLQLLIGLVILPGGKRSAAGTELFYQLLGLRRFLRTLRTDDALALLERDPQYFYRMVPYAEALGIGKRFARKFAGHPMEGCPWLDWKGLSLDSADAFYDRFSLLLDETEKRSRTK